MVILFAACASSPESRIAEKQAVFDQLEYEDQARIRRGEIREGFSADLVYLALGRPSSKEPAYGTGGEKWTYRNYYPTDTSVYRGGSADADPNADVSTAKLEVWFHQGRVTRFQVTP